MVDSMLRNMRNVAFAAMAGGLLAGCVSTEVAGERRNGTQIVRSGQPTVLNDTWLTMDTNCRTTTGPTGRVAVRPRHGKVRFVVREGRAIYGPGPHRHCNGAVGRSLAMEYASEPGYRGRDSFQVWVRYADGETVTRRFSVEVR